MIYSLFGSVVTITRVGKLSDVRTMEKRTPDKIDRDSVKVGAYVVIRYEDGREQLTHIAKLKADDGLLEINRAIRDLKQ